MKDLNKNKLIDKLELFNEEYTLEGDSIIIKVSKSLSLCVTFVEGKIIMEGKLTRLNFLTGLIKLNMNSLYSYTSMLPIFATLLVIYLLILYSWKDLQINNNHLAFLTSVLIIIFCWTIVSLLHFYSSFYFKKLQISNWLSQN